MGEMSCCSGSPPSGGRRTHRHPPRPRAPVRAAVPAWRAARAAGRLRRGRPGVRGAGERAARRLVPGVPLGRARRAAQHGGRLRADAPGRRVPAPTRSRHGADAGRRRARRRRAATTPGRCALARADSPAGHRAAAPRWPGGPHDAARGRPARPALPRRRAAQRPGREHQRAAPPCSPRYQERARRRPGRLVRRGGGVRGHRRPGRRRTLRRRGVRGDPRRARPAPPDDGAAGDARGVARSCRTRAGRAAAGAPAQRPREPGPSARRADLRVDARPPTSGTGKDRDYGNHDRLAAPDARSTTSSSTTPRAPTRASRRMVQRPEVRELALHDPLHATDMSPSTCRRKDIAWHAGNWDVNTRSIGIEHEGFLAKGGTWYTEAMYRASARLVKYLAAKHDIPLDRAHILGHDNVPGHDRRRRSPACTRTRARTGTGRTTSTCWAGRSRRPRGTATVGHHPPRLRHQPARASPAATAGRQGLPAARRLGGLAAHGAERRRPAGQGHRQARGGKPSTYSVVRPRRPRLHRPALRGRRAAGRLDGHLVPRAEGVVPQPGRPAHRRPGRGPVVTPVADDVKVYGRAYPEKSAYHSAPPTSRSTPLQYRIAPGQTYTRGPHGHRLLLRRERLQPGQARHRHGHGPLPPDPVRATGSCSSWPKDVRVLH